jgi:hypothetical protein
MTLLDVALVLVMGCVGEIDFPKQPDECVLMWHVQGVKVAYEPEALARQIKNYNTIFRSKSERARWVLALTVDGERPEHFPSRLAWERPMVNKGYSRRQSVTWIFAAAFAFLEARTKHPCPRAKHYGGRCEVARGACDPIPECARIDCGETSQAYSDYGLCRRRKTMPAYVAAGQR